MTAIWHSFKLNSLQRLISTGPRIEVADTSEWEEQSLVYVLGTIALAIMELHEFLVEHAMFPIFQSKWTGHAVRDDNLVQKLCKAFEDILGDIRLAAGAERVIS